MGQHGAGDGVCRLAWPPCTSTNAVSVFSLSLSRACTPVPTRHPGWPVPRWGGQQKTTGRSSRAARGEGTCPPPARLPQTLVVQPSGASASRAREPHIDCAPPRSPHQKYRRRTEDSEGQRGIVAGRRSGRLTCSCTKLSPCSLPPPSVSSGFFPSSLPHLHLPWFRTGKQSPPSLPASWVTSSRHVSSSFCVCLFKLVFLPPLFFSAPPPSSAM